MEKIAKTHPELQNDIDSIYDSENGTLATIVNGLGPLSDFMNSISDETLDTMLEDKNKTQQIFEDIMKKSGLETEINWLQQKESLELTPSDLVMTISENYWRVDLLNIIYKRILIMTNIDIIQALDNIRINNLYVHNSELEGQSSRTRS